jgi:hypothetical protein
MNIKSKLILATAALALLSAPASARTDGDAGGLSAYAFFHNGAAYRHAAAPRTVYVRPRATVHRPQRSHHS